MEGGVKMLAPERSSVEGETTFRWVYARNLVLAFIAFRLPTERHAAIFCLVCP